MKLGEYGKIVMGQSPDSRYYNDSKGLPLIQGNADIIDRKTIVRVYTSQVTKSANKGDILFTVRAPVGNVAKASFDCCIGRGVCAIKEVSGFLYHYLVFIESSWATMSSGSTFDSINSKTLEDTILDIPEDQQEQFLIATVLSEMDNEIISLMQKYNKTIHIKQGMMQQLLTGKKRLI